MNESRIDPRRCAVLVPYSGSIHRECDDALRTLEQCGYMVRRVGGYASIDAARNQMATDAIRDGFEETLWIDSDIGFDPDAVERLRSHQLPIVCGVYPKKGQRAIACHVLPGSPQMTFGAAGGLAELLYAATGFLLVRREVYLTMQRQLALPTCNEAFGEKLVPYFMPLIRPLEGGWWYLSEDYSFCHRARECGYKIFADTTIRLWHIGTYRYGWEDAGIERERFATFTLNFPQPVSDSASPSSGGRGENCAAALRGVAARYAWPAERPVVPAFPERNWLFPATRELLSRSLPHDARVVLELGSWTGRSTRYLADLAPQAIVVAIDHWNGSPEHVDDPELGPALARLYETFLSECWEYRERIIPLRATMAEGLRSVSAAGAHPELVYIDGDHRYESVLADLTTTLELFPQATVVGDDWDWDGVRKAVETVARERNVHVDVLGAAWRIVGRNNE